MATPGRAYKILVVDDELDVEPLVLQRFRRDIRAGDYQFVFAHNGVEALEVLNTSEERIDMVVSDINMPQMDGLTLLEQIPKVDPNIRSIIVSAYGDMGNIRTAMNRGAFDFVTKPIDFEDLKVTIDRTLRHLEEWRAALSARDNLVALQNELNVAHDMQQSILPTVFPNDPRYHLFATMDPARNVGGDFYDVIRLANDRIGLAIADVSDKGVPAALFMMSSRTLLKGTAIGAEDPGEVLTEVNGLLSEDNDSAMFVTLLYGYYDPVDGTLVYANGGHNSPLVVRADGGVEFLPLTKGIALGVAPVFQYKSDSFKINPGDTIILYTDGVSEAMNEEGEEFGTKRMEGVFEGKPPMSSEEATTRLFEALREFVGETAQSDDITCLTLYRPRSTT